MVNFVTYLGAGKEDFAKALHIFPSKRGLDVREESVKDLDEPGQEDLALRDDL